jgi:site-specific recombinase XerC
MTPKAFHALFGRIGERAKMPFPIHPHMLRHGCGYALANAGHDTRALQAWLGHKNIQHTVVAAAVGDFFPQCQLPRGGREPFGPRGVPARRACLCSV